MLPVHAVHVVVVVVVVAAVNEILLADYKVLFPHAPALSPNTAFTFVALPFS